MNFEWKNWCRFCGNAENNVKYEATIDIQYHFKILDSSPKVCQSCNSTLNEFQEFFRKTDKINELFQEIVSVQHSNQSKINEIREKFDLESLEVECDGNEVLGKLLECDIKEDLNVIDEENGSSEFCEDSLSENQKITIRASARKSKNLIFVKPQVKRTRKKATNQPQKGSYVQLTKDKLIPTICHICNLNTLTIRDLQKHTASVHNCRPKVPCICSFIIDNHNSYYRHRKRCCASLVAPYRCDLCKNRYSTKTQIEKHMNLKHKCNSVRNICSTCGLEFKYPTILRKHLKTHLPDEIRKIHACNHCDKKFAEKTQLLGHISTVHEDSEKKFICHICSKSYKTKPVLISHIETHNTQLNFECSTCSKRFKSATLLRIHRISHQARRYFCEICNQGFRRPASKKLHMIVHSSEKPFACYDPNCLSTFKRKKEVETHFNIVHLKKQQYICRICDKDFYYIRERLEHMRVEHPREYEEHEQKYKFFRKENQIQHD